LNEKVNKLLSSTKEADAEELLALRLWKTEWSVYSGHQYKETKQQFTYKVGCAWESRECTNASSVSDSVQLMLQHCSLDALRCVVQQFLAQHHVQVRTQQGVVHFAPSRGILAASS
jgi:hypothetical protein